MKYGKLDYFVKDTRFNSFLDITLHSSFLLYLTEKLNSFYTFKTCPLIFGFLNQLRRSQINAPPIRIIRRVFEDYRKKLCNVRTYTPSRQFITILTQQKSETLELKTLYVLHDINQRLP